MKRLEKDDVVGVLMGRKGKESKEWMFLLIKKEVLEELPEKTTRWVAGELNRNWGNKVDGMTPEPLAILSQFVDNVEDYRYKTFYIYPEKGDVTKQAKEIVSNAKHLVKKALNEKVFEPRRVNDEGMINKLKNKLKT